MIGCIFTMNKHIWLLAKLFIHILSLFLNIYACEEYLLTPH